MIEAIVLALALAADAAAVAAASGTASRRTRDALHVAIVFGGFQAGMAAIGWAIGAGAARYVEAWDHWIAAGLLGALGVRMIIGGLRGGDDDAAFEGSIPIRRLLVLGVATSIDALAAGVTLPMLPVAEPIALALIGGVTAALSLVAFAAGRAAGVHLGSRLEVVGGVALLAIGARLLLQHLG